MHGARFSHAQVAFPIHLLAELGVKKLIISNAAGGINRFYRPGDFMVIVDHVNLMFDNPLFGPNPRHMGPRFPDMYSAYDSEFIAIALEEGRKLEVPIHKGVYLGVKGPSYETAAEIRMAERIGADAVGMSTVPEVITAAFRGLRVLGISFISNMATGISTQKLDHEEVTRMAEQVQDRLSLLVTRILQRI
ncbi:MAG: purine-nucleoside phosphorylase [candidate division KSB1 bacterium]|nr:purine-nucleoside phosphorylase [candidate division KSB1 bacterium]